MRRSRPSGASVGIVVGAAVVSVAAWVASPWVELMRRRQVDESGLLWLDVGAAEGDRVSVGDSEDIDREGTSD